MMQHAALEGVAAIVGYYAAVWLLEYGVLSAAKQTPVHDYIIGWRQATMAGLWWFVLWLNLRGCLALWVVAAPRATHQTLLG